MATRLPLVTRVRSGISWNVSSSFIGQFIGFLRSLILARLLVPEDFGLFAMALTIVGTANAVTSIGLDRKIIANKFETEDELRVHLDKVWSTELTRSIIVVLLVSLLRLSDGAVLRNHNLESLFPFSCLRSWCAVFKILDWFYYAAEAGPSSM